MKHLYWLLAMVCLTLFVGMTPAQYPYNPGYSPGTLPNAKPPVSPYLNLFRQGNSPAFNYNTLVRPQLQFQQGIQGLQNQFNTVQQSVTTLGQQAQQGPPLLPATGHPAGFMTHKVYFMNLGGAGSMGSTGTSGPGVGGTGLGGVGTAGSGLAGAGLKTSGGSGKKR